MLVRDRLDRLSEVEMGERLRRILGLQCQRMRVCEHYVWAYTYFLARGPMTRP